MNEPSSPRSPRSNAEYRWNRAKFATFNETLARTGSVAAATRAVGMSRQAAYQLRRRIGSDYAAWWDDAVAQARIRLRRLSGRRATR